MSAGRSACLCWTLLSVCLLASSSAVPQLISVEGNEGDQSVLLPCESQTSGLDHPTVEWIRSDLSPSTVHQRQTEGDDLKNQNQLYSNRTSMKTDALTTGDLSLNLRNLQPSDIGTYTCSITDFRTGYQRLRDVHLQVKVSQVTSVEGYEGDQSVLLPCESQTSGLDTPTVEWIRSDLSPSTVHQRQTEGDDLKNQNQLYSDRTSMKTDALTTGDLSLNLRNLQPSDSGTYTCSVTDLKVGYQRLRDVHLQVKDRVQVQDVTTPP